MWGCCVNVRFMQEVLHCTNKEGFLLVTENLSTWRCSIGDVNKERYPNNLFLRNYSKFSVPNTSREQWKGKLTSSDRLDHRTVYKQEDDDSWRIIINRVTLKTFYKRSLRLVTHPQHCPQGIKGTEGEFECSEGHANLNQSKVGHMMTTLRMQVRAHHKKAVIHLHFVDVHEKKQPINDFHYHFLKLFTRDKALKAYSMCNISLFRRLRS